MKYQLNTLLAIIQQGEYDLHTYWQWVKRERSSEEIKRLNKLEPERWTAKLKTIRGLSAWLTPIVGAVAIDWAVRLLNFPQLVTTNLILLSAAARLRFLQSRGLTVIAIAGSYGKTSVKHQLFHLLSTRHFSYMTPESVNTPLGIAQSIRNLTSKHSIFIVEFGEQKPGDITDLLKLTQPDIAVVTPIGFAHLEHFGTAKNLQAAFAELNESAHRPALMIVDDQNQAIFNPQSEAIWYGESQNSSYRLSEVSESIKGTTAVITTPTQTKQVNSPLLGSHQLRNSLPGLAILTLDQPMLAFKALAYVSPAPRRLELHHNPNGTTVVDNSYNTNPGSWKEVKSLVNSISLKKVVFITAGFVELDQLTTESEHQAFAKDLIELAQGVVILRTRYNQQLRANLEKHARENSFFYYAEVNSQSEALDLIAQQRWPLQTLWLEGGCRELYQ